MQLFSVRLFDRNTSINFQIMLSNMTIDIRLNIFEFLVAPPPPPPPPRPFILCETYVTEVPVTQYHAIKFDSSILATWTILQMTMGFLIMTLFTMSKTIGCLQLPWCVLWQHIPWLLKVKICNIYLWLADRVKMYFFRVIPCEPALILLLHQRYLGRSWLQAKKGDVASHVNFMISIFIICETSSRSDATHCGTDRLLHVTFFLLSTVV